jgi:hypothetical protein
MIVFWDLLESCQIELVEVTTILILLCLFILLVVVVYYKIGGGGTPLVVLAIELLLASCWIDIMTVGLVLLNKLAVLLFFFLSSLFKVV